MEIIRDMVLLIFHLDAITNIEANYSVSTTVSEQAIQVKVKDKVKPVLSISSTSNDGKVY